MPTVEDKLRELTGSFIEDVLRVYNRNPELLAKFKQSLGDRFVAALDDLTRIPSPHEQINRMYWDNPIMKAVGHAAYESQRKPEDKEHDEKLTKFRVSQVPLEDIEKEVQRQMVEAGP